MSTTSYRAHSALASIFIVIAGLMLGGGAIAIRVVSAGEPKAAPIFWLWIGGGAFFALFGIFLFGLALGRDEKPTCPHCDKPVQVRVGTLSGKLQLDKQSSGSAL